MNVTINNLDEAIKAELENWANTELQTAANESFRETAEEAAKMLKQGGPYKERTKKYTKSWKSEQRISRKSAVSGLNGYSVYNKDHFRLTHLLEYGHQSRNGGRVRAFSHIAPVNEQAGEMVAQKIKRKLGG